MKTFGLKKEHIDKFIGSIKDAFTYCREHPDDSNAEQFRKVFSALRELEDEYPNFVNDEERVLEFISYYWRDLGFQEEPETMEDVIEEITQFKIEETSQLVQSVGNDGNEVPMVVARAQKYVYEFQSHSQPVDISAFLKGVKAVSKLSNLKDDEVEDKAIANLNRIFSIGCKCHLNPDFPKYDRVVRCMEEYAKKNRSVIPTKWDFIHKKKYAILTDKDIYNIFFNDQSNSDLFDLITHNVLPLYKNNQPKSQQMDVTVFAAAPSAPLRQSTDSINEIKKISNCLKKYDKVKPRGALQSTPFTDIAVSDGIEIKVENDVVESIDETDFSDYVTDEFANQKDKIWRVGGGCTIDQVNEKLEKVNQTLINQPGFGKITIAGCTCVSAMGSGRKRLPTQDMVLCYHVITINKNGEPVQYFLQKESEKLFGAGSKFDGIEIISDDDKFKAFQTNLGLMGVVYQMFIKTMEFFWVTERRRVYDYDEKFERYLTFLFAPTPENYQRALEVAPSKDIIEGIDGKDRLWIGTPDTVDKDVERIELWFNPYREDSTFFSYKPRVALTIHERLPEKYIPKKESGRGFAMDYGRIFSFLGKFLTDVFKVFDFKRLVNFALNSAIDTTETPIKPTKSKKTIKIKITTARDFGSNNYQKVNVTGAGLNADLSVNIVDGVPVIGICDQAKKMIDRFNEMYDDYRHYITAPFSYRFAKRSHAYLSMQNSGNGDDDKAIHILAECPSLRDTYDIESVLLEILQFMVNELGGRPHLGLKSFLDLHNQIVAEKIFTTKAPGYEENEFYRYLEALSFFDPKEKFQNRFSRGSGLV